MPGTSNRCGKQASFAVIRSYQPTRIERELLAHVFELAGQRVARRNAEIDGGQTQRDLATDATVQHGVAMAVAIELGDVSEQELERAA